MPCILVATTTFWWGRCERCTLGMTSTTMIHRFFTFDTVSAVSSTPDGATRTIGLPGRSPQAP